MSSSRRLRPGVLSQIWTNLKASLKPEERYIVGKDFYGNVYYIEKPKTGVKTVLRGYVPGDRDRWRSVPVEWTAWLRNLREDVPTEEEMRLSQLREEEQQQSSPSAEGHLEHDARISALEEQAADKKRFGRATLPKIDVFKDIGGEQTQKRVYRKPDAEYEDAPGVVKDSKG